MNKFGESEEDCCCIKGCGQYAQHFFNKRAYCSMHSKELKEFLKKFRIDKDFIEI